MQSIFKLQINENIININHNDINWTYKILINLNNTEIKMYFKYFCFDIIMGKIIKNNNLNLLKKLNKFKLLKNKYINHLIENKHIKKSYNIYKYLIFKNIINKNTTINFDSSFFHTYIHYDSDISKCILKYALQKNISFLPIKDFTHYLNLTYNIDERIKRLLLYKYYIIYIINFHKDIINSSFLKNHYEIQYKLYCMNPHYLKNKIAYFDLNLCKILFEYF